MMPLPEQPGVAVQLYTLRTILETDFEGTLGEIADIGYLEVELHSLFGRTAAQVRRLLDDLGLIAPARHVGLGDLRGGIHRAIEDTRTLGCRWVVCPFVAESERTLEGYRKIADDLNAAAAVCRDAGLALAYHNHHFEFTPIDGVIPYDVLLERCDSDLVSMELDLFWIRKGGFNPLEYFSRYPGRFPLFHVKDMSPDGEMADVGTGIIDFEAIFAASGQAGVKHYIVEHDEPTDPLESIATSFDGISRLL